MSEFEYLAVLVSLVLGLGLTHLLSGLVRTISLRDRVSADWAHLLWTGTTFLILILNWWVFFQSRTRESWDFLYFLVIVVWAVTFYMMAAILYPPGEEEEEDMGRLFRRNRRWFLGTFLASLLLDIVVTWMRGDLHDPPHYLPFVLHYAILATLGIFIDNRRFDLALAGYVFLLTLGWSFGARFFLT